MSEKPKQDSKYRLQRQSLPEALAESLRERILNGEFREGEPLVQEAIAAEYECSRMPVREALRQLEAEGLIVSKVHKGAIVTSLPLEQIMELFELRAMLETDLLAAAIPHFTKENFDLSQSILRRLEGAYESRDISKVGSLNWEFHRSLYLPANRIQTMALIQGINVQTDRYIRLQLLLTSAFEHAREEHREILRLCAAGNVTEAVPYLRQHILNAGRNLLVAIRERRNLDAAAMAG